MLTHLNDEARRCDAEGEVSERAVKCLILYPMNALVADQMARLRDLMGDPKIATKLMRNGYGRFPQFGMYTGRTEYHGWYAEPHTVEENGVETTAWEVSKKLKRTKNYIAQFENLRQRPDAWEQLKNRNKIPSIGGRPEIAPDDDELALAFDELSPVAQKDALANHESYYNMTRAELRTKRFYLDPEEDQFKRFKRQDQAKATTSHASGTDSTENLWHATKCTWAAYVSTSSTSTPNTAPTMRQQTLSSKGTALVRPTPWSPTTACSSTC